MIDELLEKYPLVSDQVDKNELRVLLRELKTVIDKGVPGAVVEFGCYEGTTSLFISRLLRVADVSRPFHAYDSFAGLPEKSAVDNSPAGMQFKAGELRASRQNFIKHFRKAGLPRPKIHAGWFKELADSDIPDHIAFAFLDGDFYDSIKDSLRLIENKLVPGSVIAVDDYQSEALPGTAKAVNEWLEGKPYKLRTEASLAIIYL
jgi:O-methyltransferase